MANWSLIGGCVDAGSAAHNAKPSTSSLRQLHLPSVHVVEQRGFRADCFRVYVSRRVTKHVQSRNRRCSPGGVAMLSPCCPAAIFSPAPAALFRFLPLLMTDYPFPRPLPFPSSFTSLSFPSCVTPSYCRSIRLRIHSTGLHAAQATWRSCTSTSSHHRHTPVSRTWSLSSELGVFFCTSTFHWFWR